MYRIFVLLVMGGADKGVVEGAQALVDIWSANTMGRLPVYVCLYAFLS